MKSYKVIYVSKNKVIFFDFIGHEKIALAISDPFRMVSFHLSRHVCVAILRHNAETKSFCWRARATLQLATYGDACNQCLITL